MLRLVYISPLACVPAYFAWVTDQSIKPYFEEHGMGEDAAHTGLVLAGCIIDIVLLYVLLLPSQTPGPGYQFASAVLAIVLLVFNCLTAKYSWEWRQVLDHAGETVLAKNCLALFIIVVFCLANAGIYLLLSALYRLAKCGIYGYEVASYVSSAV
ncbi:hypothetical protein PG994_007685 [Apiospora phragmitis]|uniref:Uncharacterized protein n=1 Tax=Apiospora phragmitis TaxID=2905665 RepID=A0ABR1UQW6_9PEZI